MPRKLMLFAALLGVAGAAEAQSSVQIYGVLDTAVEYMNHVGTDRSGLTRMPTLTGSVPSRLGFRGREDLGGGLGATFTLEMGLGADSGVLGQGGRGFGRQAFVGLNGPWGSLGLGRQYTMLFWSYLDADVIGPSLHSMNSLDNYFPNARADNSISYKGSFSGLTVGGTYSFGRDTVNAGPSPAGTNCAGERSSDSKACQEWSAMLKYDAPAWGLALAYDQLRGAPGAFGGLVSSSMTDKRTMLNGYAKLDKVKIGAGYMRRNNDGYAQSPRSDLWFIGASYVVDQWKFDAQYNKLKFKSGGEGAGQLMVLRGTYNLSKRTAAYASLGYVKNSGKAAFGVSSAQAGGVPLPGVNQIGFGAGLRHAF